MYGIVDVYGNEIGERGDHDTKENEYYALREKGENVYFVYWHSKDRYTVVRNA